MPFPPFVLAILVPATFLLMSFYRHDVQAQSVNGVCGTANAVAVSSAPSAGLCQTGSASSIAGDGPWFWTCSGNNGGATATCLAPLLASSGQYPQTAVHYAPNGNIDGNGRYVPGAAGFNLADVSDVQTLNSLPTGVKGLIWLGVCKGADADFVNAVTPFIGNTRAYGFYLMDEPDPTGTHAPVCPPANLKAESDWIHTLMPGAKTFITLMNMGTEVNPTYVNTYNSVNTGIDLFGLDPYPCKTKFDGCNYNVINVGVAAAKAWGIAESQIVPVYQAFGGGGYAAWILPTDAQEQQIWKVWASLVAYPAFDFAYSWGVQASDQALSTTPGLQTIFSQKNAGQ